MNTEQVLTQFCKVSPLPVMARIAIEHATSDEFLDGIFAKHAERQVSSELLFSSVVNLMTLVACRIRPSISAAYQKNSQEIGVSLQAVYGKLRKIEPQVTRALVRETAARLADVATRLNADLEPPFPGYENRILDGAHLAATVTAIIDDLQPGQAWIADRNFCTAVLLWEIHGNQSFFVVREHAQNVRWTTAGTEKAGGRTDMGRIFEQPIEIH